MVIITGGDRGFGASIGEVAARSAVENDDPITLILISRDFQSLQARRSELLGLGHEIRVETITYDLTQAEGIEALFKGPPFNHLNVENFKSVYVFLNHGTVGPPDYFLQYTVSQIDSEIATNLTSFSVFLWASLNWIRTVCPYASLKIRIINISSEAARTAMAGFSTYGPCKAARNMTMNTVALEVSESWGKDVDIKFLNWAPGVMNTAMVVPIQNHAVRSLREMYNAINDSDTWVEPIMSARKLLDTLNKNEFPSGAHVDYYDVL